MYKSISQYLIVGIQVIIGFTGLISFFYLGKIHDYKREYQKYEIECIFELEKTKKIIITSLAEENHKFVTDFINATSSSLDNERIAYLKYPGLVVIKIGLMLGFFGLSLIIFLISSEITNVLLFSYGLAFLINGFVFLSVVWNVYEKIISDLDGGHFFILSVLSITKYIQENKKNLVDHVSTIEEFIKLIQQPNVGLNSESKPNK